MTLLSTVLGMCGWAAVWFLSVFVFRHVDSDWESYGIIGVGDGYSIGLETRCSSPVGYAEYDQRLRVYKTEKNGQSERELGTVNLFPNTGGRTHSLVYVYRSENGSQRIQIQDRYSFSDIDPSVPRAATTNKPAADRVFVGTYSGENYPSKFLLPTALSEADSLAILHLPETMSETVAPADHENSTN